VFQITKKIIINSLDRLGYRLVSHEHFSPVDLRKLGNNPKGLGYYSLVMNSILIDVELSRGRGLDVYSLSDNSIHPFIVAIRSALDSDDHKKAIRESLSNYYRLVQPKSAAEWLGFEFGEVTALDQEPPWSVLFPWENRSVDLSRKMRKDCASQDNREHGIKADINDGWRDFGPVSDKVLDIEVSRLYSLMLSIKNFGVLRHNKFGGDIGAKVLINNENEFCWLINHGGQHRAAAISAMGYKNVAIRVWQLVERKDVAFWPNVQSGVFSEQSALKVFDRIFHGYQAPS
jgi:hypothetical protein